MPTHQEFREEIPAFVASRLPVDAARRLGAHLAGCLSCAALAARLRETLASLHALGWGRLDPHPAPMALRAYALGTPGADVPRLRRHLASCASCELEVSVWRSCGSESRPAAMN